MLQIDVQKRDQQQQLTINDFKKEFHSNPVWMKAERLLYLVDVLGYFYNTKNKDKMRYFFLDRDGYIEINAVMRKFAKTSPGDWYCFEVRHN